MSRNLEKRLLEVEQRLLDVARGLLGDCNCQKRTFAFNPEKFEEEMNRPCPAHEFRDLGLITQTLIVPSNDTRRENDAKVEQLINTYEARRAARYQVDRESE